MSHDETIRVRVPGQIKQRLQALAERRGQTISAMVRLLIFEAGEKEEKSEDHPEEVAQ